LIVERGMQADQCCLVSLNGGLPGCDPAPAD
jgi:hypothetical protein